MSKFWKKQAYLNHTAAEVDAAIDAIQDLGPKALVTPATAPAADKLVGVDTANAQEMITIGSGLKLEGGTLSLDVAAAAGNSF